MIPNNTYHEDCYADLSIPEDWTNISYGNDDCASFVFNGYHIFIAEKNDPDYVGDRFYIKAYDETGIGNYDDYYLSDSFSDVLKFVAIPNQLNLPMGA